MQVLSNNKLRALLPAECWLPELEYPIVLFGGFDRKTLHESIVDLWGHKKLANLHYEPSEQAWQV